MLNARHFDTAGRLPEPVIHVDPLAAASTFVHPFVLRSARGVPQRWKTGEFREREPRGSDRVTARRGTSGQRGGSDVTVTDSYGSPGSCWAASSVDVPLWERIPPGSLDTRSPGRPWACARRWRNGWRAGGLAQPVRVCRLRRLESAGGSGVHAGKAALVETLLQALAGVEGPVGSRGSIQYGHGFTGRTRTAGCGRLDYSVTVQGRGGRLLSDPGPWPGRLFHISSRSRA